MSKQANRKGVVKRRNRDEARQSSVKARGIRERTRQKTDADTRERESVEAFQVIEKSTKDEGRRHRSTLDAEDR